MTPDQRITAENSVDHLDMQELLWLGPLFVLRKIVEVNPEVAGVNFWKYVYRPVQFAEQGENPYWLDKDDLFDDGKIKEIVDSLPEDCQLGIYSRVVLSSGASAHIPLMDLAVKKGPESLSLIQERFRKAGMTRGWLLETGESYHYYGSDLLTGPDRWIDFMGRCLLTGVVHTRENIVQLADPRYIGHSLRRGGCVLRITTKDDKTFEPKVVASIG